MFTGKFIKMALITSTLLGLPAMAQSNIGLDKTQVNLASKTCAQVKFEGRAAFKNKLGLNDSQLEKIASLKDQSRIAMMPQRAELKALNDQLKLEITKPQVNQEEALQVQNKINSLRSQLATEKLQERLNFISILTPEQKDTLRHKILVSEAFGGRGERVAHQMHKHFTRQAQG